MQGGGAGGVRGAAATQAEWAQRDRGEIATKADKPVGEATWREVRRASTSCLLHLVPAHVVVRSSADHFKLHRGGVLLHPEGSPTHPLCLSLFHIPPFPQSAEWFRPNRCGASGRGKVVICRPARAWLALDNVRNRMRRECSSCTERAWHARLGMRGVPASEFKRVLPRGREKRGVGEERGRGF